MLKLILVSTSNGGHRARPTWTRHWSLPSGVTLCGRYPLNPIDDSASVQGTVKTCKQCKAKVDAADTTISHMAFGAQYR